MNRLLTTLFVLLTTVSLAQNDSILTRLQGIKNIKIDFYNVDGYLITSQLFDYPFTPKGLKKIYRKYSIKKDITPVKDEELPYNNYYITNNEKRTDQLTQNNSYYFIETEEKQINIIKFSAINKRDKNLEHKIVALIIERKIPRKNYASMSPDSINFAGRYIKLGGRCHWTNVNTLQCPGYGEMNWSVHKDSNDAQNTVEHQLELTKLKKYGKVISEEMVDIEFEGTVTKAKKIIFDFTGVTSVLVGVTGGKTLTIFYVASKVRGNYVSCVLSFWNNDAITKNGLSPLLEEVMQLKE